MSAQTSTRTTIYCDSADWGAHDWDATPHGWEWFIGDVDRARDTAASLGEGRCWSFVDGVDLCPRCTATGVAGTIPAGFIGLRESGNWPPVEPVKDGET